MHNSKNPSKSEKNDLNEPLVTGPREKTVLLSKEYIKTKISEVIFADEVRTTLYEPDGWAKGWAGNCHDSKTRLKRQQRGRGVMFCAGMIKDKLVGPVKVHDGVKIDSEAYWDLLEDAFSPKF